MKKGFGPGILVAAAFIGPGTVTACTLAGSNFGYALIWALVFATIATIILQDMAARLGAGAGLGLGEALMQTVSASWLKWAVGGLVFAALAIGNSAYEAGNLAGAALGAKAVMGEEVASERAIVIVLASLSGGALLIGRYKWLERILIALVLVMCAAFIIGAVIVMPSLAGMTAGLAPNIPDGGLLTAIALIGTTIVPYNLFLHAAAARRKWESAEGLSAARLDSGLSIGLGGLVSILIVSTAAASLFQSGLEIKTASDMARAIEPAFGPAARYLVGVGLLAAGLTSAITAPMATGYALSELIGGDAAKRQKLFQLTALSVLFIGTAISLLGIRPTELILIAQYANGLLLPIVAVFLLSVMNRKSLLGAHVNGWQSNLAGGAVVLITFGLGLRAVLRAAGVMS